MLAAFHRLAGDFGNERSGTTAAISSRRGCVDSHVADAGGTADWLSCDIGVGRAAARRRQAGDFSLCERNRRPDPFRRTRRCWDGHWEEDFGEIAIFER